ncbi:MAG TPA: glycosyltransferase [Solirubrobacteraceae bacterium]|jgi:GT2 family glycosyltransferase|nr:glycosyltransferase [Solirubrobacteraceae bacterium]
MTDPVPLISVVVSTYNRPEHLRVVLAALREQTLEPRSFEVVVVDNGSAESSTQAVLADEQARNELRLRSIRHEVTRGPAGGRNSGWRLAEAPLVAFTDDDCAPDSHWLERALEVASQNRGAIVQGRTEPVRDDFGLLERSVAVRMLGPQYETCNIVYPRALLEQLEGFDETFGFVPAGEDTDLAWRAIERGVPVVFAPDAVVFHAIHRLGVKGALREAARWTDAPRLFRRHPGSRAILSRGLFWNGWHYLVFRSAIALALPGPIRRFLLTRHMLQLAKRAREQGAGPWAVPLLLACDVIEVASVIRGGIRYRTFVL